MRWIAFVIVALAALAPGCGDEREVPGAGASATRSPEPRVTPKAAADARASDHAAMAAAVFGALAEGEQGNVAFSPYGIDQAFAMLYAGARGRTRDEIGRVLRFDDDVHDQLNAVDRALADRAPARLDTANAVWGQEGYPFKRPFLDVLARHYGAGVRVVDFRRAPDAAREAIDAWVEERTRGRIKELFEKASINADTRLVLANALYLKARWKEPFHRHFTRDGAFRRAGGEAVTVPFMNGRREVGFAEGDGWRAAELPYEGDRLAMTVIVPDDLVGFDAALDDVLGRLERRVVQLSLPRFAVTSDHSLVEPFKRLGIRDAFDEGEADLRGIADGEQLFVKDAVQKVFVKTGEAGTEGAAATGMAAQLLSLIEEFRVDRPFLFAVRDRPTGTILFLGRVTDPSAR